MLANVFDICNVPPNTIPLETLESYSNYRAERFTFKRFIIVVIMLIFLLIPLLFIAPKMTAVNVATDSSPVYHVTVHSLFHVTSVTASIDDNNIPVYEVSDNVYELKPSSSGNLIITASAANKQIYQLTIDVFADRHDKEAPKLLKNEVSDGQVFLYLEDNESGIDYSSAFGRYNNGDTVNPITFNSTDGYIVFKYPDEDMNIFVGDKDGNVLQLVVTVDKK